MWRFLASSSFKPRAAFQAAYTAAFGCQFNQTAKMSVDALQRSPSLRQSVSGAAACFQVTVVGSALVNRALGLQRRLVFAWGRPVGGFTAVFNTIEEVDGETWRGAEREKEVTKQSRGCVALEVKTQLVVFNCTDDHPDGEAAPCSPVQLHHEVDVDENTEQGQPGKQRDLERTEKRMMWGKKVSIKDIF